MNAKNNLIKFFILLGEGCDIWKQILTSSDVMSGSSPLSSSTSWCPFPLDLALFPFFLFPIIFFPLLCPLLFTLIHYPLLSYFALLIDLFIFHYAIRMSLSYRSCPLLYAYLLSSSHCSHPLPSSY